MQPRKYGFGTVLLVVLGLFFLRAIFNNSQSREPEPRVQPAPTSYEDAAEDKPHEPKNSPLFHVGDEVKIGYWTYSVNSVRWSSFVGDSEYSMEHADAMFVIVNITATNNDRTSSTLPLIKLVDAEGREYDSSSKDFLVKGRFGPLKTMNPDVPVSGSVMFDVPPERIYKLRLSGGFESKEFAAIVIPRASE